MKSSLGIVGQCDKKFDLKVNVCHSDIYISWSIDFALYLKDYLIDDIFLDNVTV